MTATSVRTEATHLTDGLEAEVIAGLKSSPKTLPPKLFYDARGAELFERICELPEYYLTRSELSILTRRVPEIAALAGPNCAVIEYGSGAGIKARLILDALNNPLAYVPVDISRAQLEGVASEIASEFPRILVSPVCADYTSRFHLPKLPSAVQRRVAFFPGSTIGNFHPAQAAGFLSRVRQLIGPGGSMILGVDRVKSTRDLDAAYNDAAGLTAEFNLNMLARINREAGADFDLASFEHVAFFNEEASRIEMHLRSWHPQTVHLAGEEFELARGETIWTESSYKYDRDSLDCLVCTAGFRVAKLWTDDAERLWVAYLDA
ncbi:MAG: L-histidine N(alpha)-methyltransferase [Gemmatimonadales bacterium]